MPDYTTSGTGDEIYAKCGLCGDKYPLSAGHVCQVRPNYPAWTQGELSPVIIIDGETKRLLERIAVALEKLTDAKPIEK